MAKRCSFQHSMHKGSDNCLHLVKMPLKEVIRTLHGYQTFRGWHMLKPLNCKGIWSLFIFCALDDKFGFVASLEIFSLKHACRYSQANHRLYTVINSSNSQCYISAKRET